MPGIAAGPRGRGNGLFAALFGRGGRCGYCLPCRRSRVRIPSAALEKACICRSFSCQQPGGAFASRRTETGRTANQPYFRLEESACLQGILDRSNGRPLARDAEGHEFDPRASPVSVRDRALARAGPTDLQDNRLGPRSGACRPLRPVAQDASWSSRRRSLDLRSSSSEVEASYRRRRSRPDCHDEAGVSDRDHPRGPFAWCEVIGVEHVCSVLDAFWRERREERYRIAPLPERRAMLAGWRPQT